MKYKNWIERAVQVALVVLFSCEANTTFCLGAEDEIEEMVASINSRDTSRIRIWDSLISVNASNLGDFHLARIFANRSRSMAEDRFASIATPVLLTKLQESEKAIYGTDNRVDWYGLSASVKILSRSVAAMVNACDLRDNGDGTCTLQTTMFGAAYKLCQEELFFKQPIAAFGSSFLVKSNLICTALHCVTGKSIPALDAIRFVFDFQMTSSNSANAILPNASIFKAQTVKFADEGYDVALITLDRAVIGREPLKVRNEGKIGNREFVSVIGHPCGLPLKFAEGAYVRQNSNKHYFVANLDTFGGNSGSPVFGTDNVVEGVLTRGGKDFVKTGSGCLKARVVPTSGALGEQCSRILSIAREINSR